MVIYIGQHLSCGIQTWYDMMVDLCMTLYAHARVDDLGLDVRSVGHQRQNIDYLDD